MVRKEKSHIWIPNNEAASCDGTAWRIMRGEKVGLNKKKGKEKKSKMRGAVILHGTPTH